MALNYITSISTGQSVFVEQTTAGAPTTVAPRGSIAIINVSGGVAVYINSSAGTTGTTWTLVGGGVGPPGPPGPAGTGVTVIAPGGTMSGSYSASVYAEGNVTIAGATTVGGDLIVAGNLVETAAFSLVVNGDLIVAGNIDYTAVATPQATIDVHGDLICNGQILIPQKGGASSSLIVKGDMTAGSSSGDVVNLAPTDENTDGGTIDVGGSLTARDIRLGVSPGNMGNNAGTLNVGGDATFDLLTGHGGSRVTAGLPAGDGAVINIRGNCTAELIAASGGLGATLGSGGAGGQIAFGSVDASVINVNGGNCATEDPNYVAGSAGSVYVRGTVATYAFSRLSADILTANGGTRGNTLTGSAVQPAAIGGTITVYGDATINTLEAHGGDVQVSAGTSQPGGIGGVVLVRGSFRCGTVTLRGGQGTTLPAGNGGSLTVDGDLLANTLITAEGGGFSISPYVLFSDGGNGGTINVRGNAWAELSVRGGDGGNLIGNGGHGGSINVGSLNGNTSYTGCAANGGNCSSSDSSHGAGNGGTILIRGDATAGYLRAIGGNRTGTLTSNGNGRRGLGGEVEVSGSVKVGDIQTNGGNINVIGGFSFNAALPPNGGEITLKGPCSAFSVRTSGGNTNAGDGGIAGAFSSPGSVWCSEILGAGGDTTFAGATAGRGAWIELADVTVALVNLSDGTGAVAPAQHGRVTLNGSCVINSLTIAADGQVRADPTCVLRLRAMSPKNTLNLSDGTPTSNQAAFLATSLYIFDGTTPPGQWLSFAGTAI